MIQRTNDQWLAQLRSNDSRRQDALTDLSTIILSGLPYALEKWIRPDDPRFAAFAEEVTQETLLRVLARLDTFEGRSQFTTWVHTIAVRIALSELRRTRWQEVSLNELLDGKKNEEAPRDFPDHHPGTEAVVEQSSLLEMLEKMMREDLSDKQRRALLAAASGMPMDQIADKMQMERNALYKLLHDARLKLKKKLEQEGLSPAAILASFEEQ
jgi:RNA polymerase sigma-70 factor (ECF subfamily)